MHLDPRLHDHPLLPHRMVPVCVRAPVHASHRPRLRAGLRPASVHATRPMGALEIDRVVYCSDLKMLYSDAQ